MGQTASSLSASDRFAPALDQVEQRFKKLQRQFENREFNFSCFLEQPDCETLSTLGDRIQAFKFEFRFLTMFLDMVHKSTYRVQLELKSHLPQIEAAINEIGKDFVTATGFIKVSNLVHAFSNLLENIEHLKPEIGETCDYLWTNQSNSVEHNYPDLDDYDHWVWDHGLVKSVRGNLQTLTEKAELQIDPLQTQIKAFQKKLSCLSDFLLSINIPIAEAPKPKVNVLMVHSGAISMHAANLSCLCWLRKMDQSMAEEMSSAFSHLEQKIDPAIPEFLDMVLTFLETINLHCYDREFAAEMFVQHLLHFKEPVEIFGKMVCLISTFIKVRQMCKKNAQPLLPDIAAVVKQAGYLQDGGGPDRGQFKLKLIFLIFSHSAMIIHEN